MLHVFLSKRIFEFFSEWLRDCQGAELMCSDGPVTARSLKWDKCDKIATKTDSACLDVTYINPAYLSLG